MNWNSKNEIIAYTVGQLLDDTSPIPEDLIGPRVLTPSGLMVLTGLPKVGKSYLLLSLLTHMAAGKSFLGLKPPRPLRVYYLQSKIELDYLCERVQQIAIDESLLPIIDENFAVTSPYERRLDEQGVEGTCKAIQERFPHDPVDIIAIDPLYDMFDGGENQVGSDDAMFFFLQERIDVLRERVNPNAGVILVHDIYKIQREELEEDPLYHVLYSTRGLFNCYSSALLLFRPNRNQTHRKLFFDLRNGAFLKPKTIDMVEGVWQEVDCNSKGVL